MKIRSHFSDLKSAAETVRMLKLEGIKSAYVDANEYRRYVSKRNNPYANDIEMSFTNSSIDSRENNSIVNSIKGGNNNKRSNIFVVIDAEDEKFNKVKAIVESMGGVFE